MGATRGDEEPMTRTPEHEAFVAGLPTWARKHPDLEEVLARHVGDREITEDGLVQAEVIAALHYHSRLRQLTGDMGDDDEEPLPTMSTDSYSRQLRPSDYE
jgi:hypothetical protein